MKSVRRKGLALVAVSSSVLGVGIGMAGSASAVAWSYGGHGPTVDLKVSGKVAGTGASAVLTVDTDNTGSTGLFDTTDFGDGSKTVTTATATHAYAAGALKQTLTEKSLDAGQSISSTTQVGVDATDPSHIVYTRSVPINLAAAGAVVTHQGDSALDLNKILPAGADPSRVSGTCDTGTGAPALGVDLKTGLASCDWTAATAAGHHTVTLTYTDKATGLTSTSQEAVAVPVQPSPTFTAVVLAKGLVQLDLTGSAMDVGLGGTGTGTIDWGDSTTTTVSFPLHNDEIQNHTYATDSGAPRTITFSITDSYGEHGSFSVTISDWTPSPVNYGQLTRLSGATRYGTGVAVSQAAFPYANSADAVVLARGDQYADALAGIPLAKRKNGPLLLTPGGPNATTLDSNVAAEIRRVLPMNVDRTVYILGGTEAIPQRIADYIKNTLGYNVERFAGADRYATALSIAQNPDAMDNPGRVVVARGDDFADALASGPLAADAFTGRYGLPSAIVLSTGSGVGEPVSLTPGTAKYVTSKLTAPRLLPGVTNVAAVGGGAVKAVVALTGDTTEYTPIAGADRYSTAAKVAAQWGAGPWGEGQPVYVGVASGTNFPDSLTGGAMMAQLGFPLLLSDPRATSPALSPAPAAIIAATNSSLMNTYLFGGTKVFGDPVAQSLMKLEGVSAAHYRIVTEPF